MISIITAVHNGLAMNRLFWEYLSKYTYFPFELIIIDNCSTDGSREFFKSVGAKVIENEDNYSYPVCQNQGIKVASHDILVFINNDIIVSPEWDKKLLETMEFHDLSIITPVSIENMGDKRLSRKLRHRWLRVRNVLSIFGYSYYNLKLMHLLMYCNWEKHCKKYAELNGFEVMEGILGHTVMMKKSAIEKIGLWDERIQGADFDLFFRARKHFMEIGDIKPVHFAKGVVLHHFIRLTVKTTRKEFADKANLITVEDKWGIEQFNKYASYMN